MIRVTHKRLYQIAGAVWLLVGVSLLRKGSMYALAGYNGDVFTSTHYSPLFLLFENVLGSTENALALIIVIALILGNLKGKLVLSKMALKMQKRIQPLEEPISIAHLYTRSNVLLIGAMMLLGIILNALFIGNDIRACIDIAVGAALVRGAMRYFTIPCKKNTI